MGIFSKMFSNAKDLTKIANAVSNIKIQLDDFEENIEEDFETYLTVAWVCRVGVLDIIEKNKWPMRYILYAKINGHNTKMTLNEAYFMTVGRLHNKMQNMDDESKNILSDILEKGESFYKIDKIVPLHIKKLFE